MVVTVESSVNSGARVTGTETWVCALDVVFDTLTR